MALSASTVWEVRTTGSDTNGGGYVSGGTDWSQQDAAQYSVTDAVTAGTTTITSATASFGTDVVGNILYIQGGTAPITAGWYQIISRTNATTIVVDRSTGLTAGTGATVKIGGALATPSQAFALQVGSNTVWIKNGSYTMAANPTMNAAGVFSNPTVNANRISGYNTSRGDNPTGSGRPTITATSATTIMLPLSTAGWWVEYLILNCGTTIANTAITISATSSYSQVRFCKLQNFRVAGINTTATANWFAIRACEFTGGTSAATAAFSAANTAPGGHRITECYIHDNACPGIVCSDSAMTIEKNIIETNTGASSDGIRTTYGTLIRDNTIYANGRHGVAINNASGGPYSINQAIRGNILANNVGSGISTLSGSVAADSEWDGNAYRSNTGGERSGIGTGTLDVTLTADPFVDGPSGNFALNNTAGGGAACRAAGIPGVFPGGLTTGYLDIGAVQHQDPAGGGGSLHQIIGSS